ncbi:nuclear transport factor 2 family protein [Kamptonema cortianum]|nr:nuclear transport factor 2 family protein [Geitlerinema splendidum]MDK3158452.1 nuclear transport factor 2 family protein [Kamptonema cortianum]
MDPVEGQLQGYNARDIDVFMSYFHPDVKVLDGSGNITLEGWEAKKDRYTTAFQNEPNVKCEIVTRIRLGKYVVDHELLTGYLDGQTREAVAIYTLKDNKIIQVQFLK